MSRPPEVDKLLQAYFAGDTSAETIQAMEAWLREDPANPRILAEYGLVDRLMFCEQKTLDTSAIFALLLEAEEAAEPIVVSAPNLTQQAHAQRPHEPLKYKQALLGLRSMTFDAMRQKAGVITGIAAILTLALIVAIVFRGDNQPGNETAQQPDITNPNEPVRVGPDTTHSVATLTAEHDAQWSTPGGTLAPTSGDALRSGQRLTLTAGFAEITTNDGAVAILEAPATVELIDSNNAIRLHTGKLVGICETESSKGFLVRTPHLDVTDLGTRFGVDATSSEATEVHVIEGLVEVAQSSVSGDPVSSQRVSADQAVVSTARGLSAFVFDSDRFVSDLRTATVQQTVRGEVAWFDHPLIELKESDHLQVYTERTGLTLVEDLPVDFDGQGNRPGKGDSNGLTIPAGTAVDVYLLYLDTPGDAERIVSFTVPFDRPILGILGAGRRLDQTDTLFAPGTPRNHSGSARGAIEDLNNPDLISDDARTLHLTLRVAGTTDQLRVLVAAAEE